MKWITRKDVKVDRVASPWLIKGLNSWRRPNTLNVNEC
jgi:hypothetical protein